MIDIRIHGRGGQGAVVASLILGRAAHLQGYHIQAFPEFGVERRGAPVTAFCRLDKETILLRTRVTAPAHVVVLDASLADSVDVTAGLDPEGWIIVNTATPPPSGAFGGHRRVAWVDAAGIAAACGVGTATTPIVNTAMVGAVARATGLVEMDSVAKAILDMMPQGAEGNTMSAREAHDKVELVVGEPADTRVYVAPAPPAVPQCLEDVHLPNNAMSLAGMQGMKTGSWRFKEPRYEDQTPPCNNVCLTGNDIVSWMRHVDAGDMEAACRTVLETNPIPAILGRVCPHPCEQPCNRKAMGGGVPICSIERFLGDMILEQSLVPAVPPATGKKFAVTGSGPGGLAVAYFLRLKGHAVTVFEASHRPGGLLANGIPAFRLPEPVVKAQIDWFASLGIEFVTNRRFGVNLTESDLTGFDGRIFATGFSVSTRLGIPGEENPQIKPGLRTLAEVRAGEAFPEGQRVIVVGGGNTAVDCARTALRMGRPVVMVYRRTRREMPALKEEVDAAVEEGIDIRFLTQPVKVETENGKLCGITCITMKLGEKDKSGRARPVPVEGSEHTIPCDLLLTALGEGVDATSMPTDVSAVVQTWKVPAGGVMEREGVFVAGDISGRGGTVAQAVRDGRDVATAVQAWLTGSPYVPANATRDRGASQTVAKFKEFNPSRFKKEPPPALPVVPHGVAIQSFDEVHGGLTLEQVAAEGRRCFKCGTCNGCGVCEAVCPDLAIVPAGEGRYYRIDLDHCKGCGVCAAECPRAGIRFARSVS